MSDPTQPPAEEQPQAAPAPAQPSPPPPSATTPPRSPGATPPPPPPGYAAAPTPGGTTVLDPTDAGAPAVKESGGFAVTSLVLGIIAVVFAFTPAAGFGVFLGILALVFGVLALRRKPAKRGKATAGSVLGIIAAVLGLIMAIVYAATGSAPVADSTPAAASHASASASAAPVAKPVKTAPPQDPNAAYTQTYGTFTEVDQSGTGDSVIAIPAGAKAGIVTASHQGSANFSINVLDASNQSTGDLLVNTIGNYSGVTAFGLNSLGNAGTNIQIQSDGPWTIKIQPISAAPAMPLPASATGDQVYKYDGNAANWAFTNQGQGNFAVVQYGGPMPNLAINQIGNYTGKVPMLAGPSVIVITSDGAWTVAAG